MSTTLLAAILLAIFSLGLFIEAAFLYWRHDDHACAYKLFAIRDKLVRLAVEGKVERHNPFFDALYQNVSMVLRCSHYIGGPDGWPRATAIGHYLAHRPNHGVDLNRLPGRPPESMRDIMDELRTALLYLSTNHFGIYLQIDANRRERAKIQAEQAKRFLEQIPHNACHV